MSLAFYNETGLWFARKAISERDRLRAAFIADLGAHSVLELGCGWGGTAAATAELGMDVLAVDYSPVRAAKAREHSRDAGGKLVVICDDMHSAHIKQTFDVVAYWAGFGLGTPLQNRLLLSRVSGWLAEAGVAVIDVFNPEWWIRRSGETREERSFGQEITYNAATGQLVDRRWRVSRPDVVLEERIRCYTVEEFQSMASESGLQVRDVRPSIGSNDPPSNLVILQRAEL